MTARILLFLLLFCVSLTFCAAPAQSSARIQEIAATLAPKAGGFLPRWNDRAFWDTMSRREDARKFLKEAEKHLDAEIPPCPDSLYNDYQDITKESVYVKNMWGRLWMLSDCTLAELLENQGRYLPKITELLETYCAWRTWVCPSHDGFRDGYEGRPFVELFAAHDALMLAEVLDAFQGRIPDTLQQRTRTELQTRVFAPYLASVRGKMHRCHWWFWHPSNWNAVCHGEVLQAALMLLDDPLLRAEFAETFERAASIYVDSFADDGYCREGIAYWGFGYGNYMPAVLFLRAATGGKVDILHVQGEKQRRIINYAVNYCLERRIAPAFTDGTGFADPNELGLARMLCPDLIPLELVNVSPFSQNLQSLALRHIFPLDATAGLQKDSPLPLRTYFPDGGVYICRSRSDAPHQLAIGFKGGNNDELHNHNDLGSYTISLDGAEMAGDPGNEVYTARTFSPQRYQSRILNSYGHPVPRPADILQGTGAAFRAKFTNIKSTDDLDEITIDLTSGYPPEAYLEELTRTFRFDRVNQTLTITDHVRFNAPAFFESPVVSYCQWIPANHIGGYQLRHPKGQKLNAQVSVEGGEWEMVEEEIVNPNKPDVPRHAIRMMRPVTEATISVQFSITQ
ncbi:MAG: hypothetical protein MJ202_02760 [Lentisphaeria bacterium]|nr:hypothetical protein [Lentisphaeria bacterium]